MGPSGRIGYIFHILDCLGQVNAGFIQVLCLARAPRTKETLPDFLKWRRVTRHPLVFCGLKGSQRTPGFWGVTPVNSRNTSGCRVTRRHFRKSGRVSFVWGALPKYNTCMKPVPSSPI